MVSEVRKCVRSAPAIVFALSGPKMFIILNIRRIIKVTLVKLQNVSYYSEKNFRNDLKSTVYSKNLCLYYDCSIDLKLQIWEFLFHCVVRMMLAFLDFLVYLFITRGPRWQNNRVLELERTTQDGEYWRYGGFLLKKTHYRITVHMGPGPLGLRNTTHTLWLHSLFPFSILWGSHVMMLPSGHLHISRLMMHLFTYLLLYLAELDPVLRLWVTRQCPQTLLGCL